MNKDRLCQIKNSLIDRRKARVTKDEMTYLIVHEQTIVVNATVYDFSKMPVKNLGFDAFELTIVEANEDD